jgi:hypothetical protein
LAIAKPASSPEGVDPVARRQLLDGLALKGIIDAQVQLSDKGIYVGLNGKHSRYPSSLEDPVSCRSISLSEAPGEF